MASELPKISNDALYQLIRTERFDEFNRRKASGEKCDLKGHNFRGLDLRKLDLAGLDLSNSYFRQADLRGLNLVTCRLEGASIHDANISGVLFPKELSADEILLSHARGTRMRYR
ncbi:MAG: pentapeptide repeat-containing protein [Steroidobacteraceae bacterium]